MNIIMKNKSGILIALILTASLILSSCGPKPKEVLTGYEQAYNKHDISKILSYYSDDAELEISILSKLKGKAELADYARYDSVMNTQIKISDIANSDDKTMFVMYLTNDMYRTIGIDTAKYSMTFTIDGGKITKMSGTTTHETDQKIQDFSKKFMLWAATDKLDELNRMMPNGRFKYTAENAKEYMSMILEYKLNNGKTEIKAPAKKKKVNRHW